MKRLLLIAAIAGLVLMAQGSAVYAPPHAYSAGYYSYPTYYYGPGYGYRPFGYYGFRPRPYGWGGYGWHGHGRW